MLHAILLAAFVVGVACNLTKLVPQFFRTAVRGHVSGLSPTAVWLSLAISFLWLSYATAAKDYRFAASTAIAVLLKAGIVGRFATGSGREYVRAHVWRGAVAVGAMAVLAVLAITGREVTLSRVGSATSVVHALPQLVFLARFQGSDTHVDGVSTATLAITTTAQLAWFTYWALQTKWLLAATAAWAGAAVFLTLFLIYRQRRILATHGALFAQ